MKSEADFTSYFDNFFQAFHVKIHPFLRNDL